MIALQKVAGLEIRGLLKFWLWTVYAIENLEWIKSF